MDKLHKALVLVDKANNRTEKDHDGKAYLSLAVDLLLEGLEELSPFLSHFDKFRAFLGCERCREFALGNWVNLRLDVLSDCTHRPPVTLKKDVGTDVGKSLFDGLQRLSTTFNWADLPAGHLVVVDFFEDFPQFRLLACRRNHDLSFSLLVNFGSDGKRTFFRDIKFWRFPFNNLKVLGELERLGFSRLDLLRTHVAKLA